MSCASRFPLPAFYQPQDLPGLGVPAELRFLEDRSAVAKDLEPSLAGWNQLHLRGGMLRADLGRQTDGPRRPKYASSSRLRSSAACASSRVTTSGAVDASTATSFTTASNSRPVSALPRDGSAQGIDLPLQHGVILLHRRQLRADISHRLGNVRFGSRIAT